MCKLNTPTGLAVANNSLHIATLTEGNIANYTDSAPSSLYKMDIIQGN